MANYKKISELETVSTASASMNVLIEDNGTLKRIPAHGNIGSGSVGFSMAFLPNGGQCVYAKTSEGEEIDLYATDVIIIKINGKIYFAENIQAKHPSGGSGYYEVTYNTNNKIYVLPDDSVTTSEPGNRDPQ